MLRYAVIRAIGMGVFLAMLSNTAKSMDINIPLGPEEYGFVISWHNGVVIGFSQDAQSFIAPGLFLSRVSMPMRDQGGESSINWTYQLWNDADDHPGAVIAEFGNLNPGQALNDVAASPEDPIPLLPGERYYIGVAPIISTVPRTNSGDVGIFLRGFSEPPHPDVYADGTGWAI